MYPLRYEIRYCVQEVFFMKSAAYILSYLIMLPLAVAVFFIVMFLCCVATESALRGLLYLTGPVLSAAGRNMLVICLSAPCAILAGSAVLAKTARQFRYSLLRALSQ